MQRGAIGGCHCQLPHAAADAGSGRRLLLRCRVAEVSPAGGFHPVGRVVWVVQLAGHKQLCSAAQAAVLPVAELESALGCESKRSEGHASTLPKHAILVRRCDTPGGHPPTLAAHRAIAQHLCQRLPHLPLILVLCCAVNVPVSQPAKSMV